MTDLRVEDGPGGDTGPGAGQPGVTGAAKEEAAQVASTAAEQGKQTVATAAQAATETAGTAAEGAKQVASEAAQQVTEVTRQATEQARELMGQAQSQLREQATAQTQKAASGLSDVGRQIRALSEGRPEKAGFAADAATQLADKIEELAGRLEQRGFDGAVSDLRNFARRRPGAFLLSAAAAGFAAGRLGKGMQAAQSSDGGGSTPTPSAYGAVPAYGGAPATPLVPPPAALAPEPYLPEPGVPGLPGGA